MTCAMIWYYQNCLWEFFISERVRTISSLLSNVLFLGSIAPYYSGYLIPESILLPLALILQICCTPENVEVEVLHGQTIFFHSNINIVTNKITSAHAPPHETLQFAMLGSLQDLVEQNAWPWMMAEEQPIWLTQGVTLQSLRNLNFSLSLRF